MDLGTIITALIIILACIAPFVVMSRKNKKRDEQFLHSLSKLAKESNTTISRYDIWHNAAIGIDETSNHIFFTKKMGNVETNQQVSLSEVLRCEVVNTVRSGVQNGQPFNVTDKLELKFTFLDKNRRETAFEFFEVKSATRVLAEEVDIATKWCKIINDGISIL